MHLPENLQTAAKNLESIGSKMGAQNGIQAWEVYWSQSSKIKAAAKLGKIDLFSKSEDLGLSFRIQRQGRIGFSFTTSLEVDAIDAAIRKAIELCEVLPADEHAVLPSLRGQTYAKNLAAGHPAGQKKHDKIVDRIIEDALKLETLCRSADKRITQIREASVIENLHRAALINSEGVRLYQEDLIYFGSVTAKAEENGQAEFDGESDFCRNIDELNLNTIARNAALFATEMLGAVQAPNSKGLAVFRNNVVQDLIGFLSSSFSAESVDKGRSLLAAYKGQKIFSDVIHLDDDGTLTGGIATAEFDGEGTATHKTALIADGSIQNWLTDSYYADKLKIKRTGNAARGIKSPPSISSSNLVLRPGTSSYDDLLKELKNGVIITNLMGLHTANSVTGDFSLGAAGLQVENGKIVRPLRGFAVAGNIIDLLKNTRRVANDVRKNGDTWTPSLLVDNLVVSGA